MRTNKFIPFIAKFIRVHVNMDKDDQPGFANDLSLTVLG